MGYKFVREVVTHLVLTKLSGLVWGCFFILTAFDGYEIEKIQRKETGKIAHPVKYVQA